MEIKSVKYVKDAEGNNGCLHVFLYEGFPLIVPRTLGNSTYAEIMRQVDAGELTIEPADDE